MLASLHSNRMHRMDRSQNRVILLILSILFEFSYPWIAAEMIIAIPMMMAPIITARETF